MRVASFWPEPRDIDLEIREITTDEDADRYDAHGHPVITISADLAGEVGFAHHANALTPGTNLLRVMHEIQVDASLPARTWHAGPRRPKEPT